MNAFTVLPAPHIFALLPAAALVAMPLTDYLDLLRRAGVVEEGAA